MRKCKKIYGFCLWYLIKGNLVFYIKSPNGQLEKVTNVSFLENNFLGEKVIPKSHLPTIQIAVWLSQIVKITQKSFLSKKLFKKSSTKHLLYIYVVNRPPPKEERVGITLDVFIWPKSPPKIIMLSQSPARNSGLLIGKPIVGAPFSLALIGIDQP